MKNEKNFDFDKKVPNLNPKKERNNSPKKNINTSKSLVEVEGGNKSNITTQNKNQTIQPTSSPPQFGESNSNNNIEPNDSQYGDEEEEQQDEQLLPDSEMIPYPDFPPEIKQPSVAFGKNFLNGQYESYKNEVSPEIVNGVDNGLNNVLTEIKESILNSDLQINPENGNINSLITALSKEVRREIDIEEAIKRQKIKELEESKNNLQKKITKLDENLKILDSTTRLDGESSGLINPNDRVEENIKKAQLKEIKNTKEMLIKKLEGIDEQVQKLMASEEQVAQMKKLNIKQFLENFERDKTLAEQRAQKYEEDMKKREQKMMNSIMKAKEKKEKEIEIKEKEEEEKRKKALEKIRIRELEKMRERNKENSEKVNYFKTHVNDKPASENEYLFKVLENEYKIREQNEIKKEIMKHRAKMKEGIVTLEEIEEFKKKQKEQELQREAEVEEERKKLKEQWKATKEILPKFESSVMQKIKEEEQKIKEEKEKEEFKKKIKMKEIKNYSEVVSKLFLPKIDENKQKVREERIKNLNARNTIQKHKRKHNRVLLVKPDPQKKRKYNWDVKLTPVDGSLGPIKEDDNKRSRSKSAKHKVPLEKPPDYLTEMRIKKTNEERVSNSSSGHNRSKQWEKMIKNNKNSLIENVEQIKMKAQELEEKAKMKEKLIHANGEINVEMQESVSGMLIDAIKAKLTILENISKK